MLNVRSDLDQAAALNAVCKFTHGIGVIGADAPVVFVQHRAKFVHDPNLAHAIRIDAGLAHRINRAPGLSDVGDR